MLFLEPKASEALNLVRTHRPEVFKQFMADTPVAWWLYACEIGMRYNQLLGDAAKFREKYDRICSQKMFSHDWFSDNIWVWHKVLAPYRNESVEFLELGVFEGRSVVFVAEYLPRSRITAVDHFAIKRGWTSSQGITLTEDSERLFDGNVEDYGARVRKIATKTWPALTGLIEANEKFDVIYLDASHCAPDALADATIAWRLLKVGGMFIFDDFLLDVWDWQKGPVGPGVLTFLQTVHGSYDWVHAGWQIVVRKTADQKLW